MMTEIFLKILNMCLSASWLVFAVLMIRLALYKAPKWIRPILWGMVGARLVFPFPIKSIFSLIPSAEIVSEDIAVSSTPAVHSGVEAVDNVVNPVMAANLAPTVENSVNPMQIVVAVATVIWLIGMTVMLLYAVISYLSLKVRLRTAIKAENPTKNCKVFRSECIKSPFVLGFISPKIYLPFSVSDETSKLVVMHEYAHIIRRDNWWKAIGFLLLSVYWFNPLLWISYMLLGRDIESACDELVIKKLTPKERADYSQALLDLSSTHKMTAACPLAYGETNVKTRVKQILSYKKPAFWLTIVAVIACVLIILCFLTDPIHGTRKSREIIFPNGLGDDVRVEYTLPEGLDATDYDEVKLEVGPAGGVLLAPNAYELVFDSENVFPEWLASGIIALYYTDGLIEWDGDEISTVWEFYNHTINEPVGALNDLFAPAYLMKENHDLYTAVELFNLENGGTDLSQIDTVSEYWSVYFARPGDAYGIVVSLNAKNYTQDDVIAFARSISYEPVEGDKVSDVPEDAVSDDFGATNDAVTEGEPAGTEVMNIEQDVVEPADAESPDNIACIAVIKEISDETLTAVGMKDGEEYSVRLEGIEASPDLQVGDTIQIIYVGNVIETSPKTFERVLFIKVIESMAEKREYFPNSRFYINGIIEQDFSHNQNLAGDFWPYFVYQYDPDNMTYNMIGGVDAWDKRVREENLVNDIFPQYFPDDIDVDGDGIVYFLLPADWDGYYKNVPMVDGKDYEAWRESYLNGAEQL